MAGRAEYQRYLASREWALKREAVRERSRDKCERCYFRKMDAVHHLTYERVGNELLTDLMAICDPCHEFVSGKIHHDPREESQPMKWLRCPICRSTIIHRTRTQIVDSGAMLLIHFSCKECSPLVLGTEDGDYIGNLAEIPIVLVLDEHSGYTKFEWRHYLFAQQKPRALKHEPAEVPAGWYAPDPEKKPDVPEGWYAPEVPDAPQIPPGGWYKPD